MYSRGSQRWTTRKPGGNQQVEPRTNPREAIRGTQEKLKGNQRETKGTPQGNHRATQGQPKQKQREAHKGTRGKPCGKSESLPLWRKNGYIILRREL